MRVIRKLATLSLSFSAAVFLAHYLLPASFLLPLAAVCAVTALAGVFIHTKLGRRMLLIGLAAACGFSLYSAHYKRVMAPCETLVNEKLTVSARITSYPDCRAGCIMQNVRFCDDRLPNVSGLMLDYENETHELVPGDEITVTLKLNPANSRYSTEYDTNISKGLYLVGTVFGEIEKTGHWSKSFLYFPQYIGNGIREKIDEIFPADTAFFMKALLTGDKSEYYAEHEDLSCAMSIAGLSHVVAVSGMHVAFLVGFLQLVLGKNRRCSLLCIVLVWLFVIMVGAPASAVRAGFMQTLLLMAPIFKRENDAITSLSFVLALILLANPFACGNIGLQLSFASMAGIVLFGDGIYNRLKEKLGTENRFVCYILAIAASSVATSIFSFPIAALHFGYVSILEIVSNILCMWAVTLLFCGGYLCCAIGCIAPAVAKVLAFALSCLVKYIALVVKCIAKLPHAALYTENYQIVLWLIVTYVIFFLCGFSKKKFRPLVPLVISLISLACILCITHVSMLSSDGTVAVMDVGNGQCIALTDGKSTVLVDCGSAGTLNNAGSLATSYLKSRGRNSVDALLLTHLHSDHAKGVVRLLNTMKVKTIIMPASAAQTAENGLYEKIVSAAETNGTELIFVDSASHYAYGDIELTIYEPSEKGDDNERCLTLTASVDGYNVLITGDAGKTVERELAEHEDLSGTDLLVAGHHGSKNSTCQELLQNAEPEAAVISVGYNNYGHPTNAVLERIQAYGVEIYRTDLMGRIIIHTA